MTDKPTYEELEQRVKELEAFEAKCEEKVVAFEHLFDLSLDMLGIADMNANFKRINKAFEKTLGYTKEELLKESFLKFIHPNDIASTIVEVEKLSLGKPEIYFENRYRCKDNSYKWLAWTSMPDLEHGLLYAVARDITEHKLIEQVLLESEERYRLLFNEMVSGFALHEIIYDNNGKPYDYRFLDLNPAFERLTGLRRIDILGKTVREVLPKIETYWIETYGEVALSGKPAHFENYSAELNRYYEVFAFRPQKGQFAVTFSDITARKQAEEALRESEERYRLLADNVTDVIWVRDMNLNITYISPSVMNQLGYTVEEAKDRTLEETWTPESLKYIREVFAEELEIEKDKQKDMDRSRTIEVEVKCKDGSTIWAEAKMSFLRDKSGEPIGVIGITRNITDRKNAEETLRESEERHRLLLEVSPDPIVVYDIEGKTIYVNPAFEQTFGWSLDELREKRIDFVPEENWPETKQAISRMLQGIKIQLFETRRLTKDGRILDIQLSSSVFFDRKKKPAGNIVILRDITDQKRAERALRNAHDELEKRVEERTAELVLTNEKLRQEIVDRQYAEEALGESEERFRMIFEKSSDGIIVADPETMKFLYVNSAICKILEYTEEELTQMGVADIHPKESLEYVVSEFKAQAKGEKHLVTNIPFLKKDETIIYMDTNSSLVRMGEKIRIMGVFRNVTERKQMEEALRESEKRYRAVVESQTEMICRFLPDGTLTFVNEAYCRFFDKRREELIGKRFWFLIPKNDRKKVFENIASLKKNNPIMTHEHTVINSRGKKCWHRWTNRAIFDDHDKLTELQAVGWDISERVMIEKVLMGSNERFRNLTEATSDWIWEVDENVIYTYVSPKIYDILGYREEEIIGKTPFDLMPPKEAERIFRIFDSIRASKQPFDCIENTNLHKKGHPVILETSGVPTFNEKGELTGYRGVDRDVTQRKRAKEELRKAHDELEKRVEERTKELKIQKSELEETNIALKVLLDKRQEDKKELEDNILTNVKEMMAPYFEKIKKTKLDDQQKAILNIVESNLNEIIKPFTRKMSSRYLNLTPNEIHIANQIRHGLNSKEIAELMGLSPQTVYNHRKNIRKKLGIESKKTNLRSHLLSIY